MSGPDCVAKNCNFSVFGAPQGSSFTWQVFEDTKLANGSASPVDSTGTSASFTTQFSKAGQYEVRVVVTQTSQGLSKVVTVTCTGSGNTEVCTAV